MISYALRHESGLYYVCEGPLIRLLEPFGEKRTVRAIAGLAELAHHPDSAPQLRFAAEWLKTHRDAAGLHPARWRSASKHRSDRWRRRFPSQMR